MNESIACPEVPLLSHFLDGTEFHDSNWSREQIELHVNDCQACQKSIERLVAGQESWEGAARQLAELDARHRESSSELRDLIDHEKHRMPATVIGEIGVTEGQPRSSMELDFLQPTDQLDSLGRLGSYEILGVVGRGGMGLVLKAYDPSLRRIVAIKVMAAHLASSPVARKRFVREARAAAAVSHDHVVAIYAVEENQEPPFLVMQFVSGKTLQERLVATGSFSVPEILRIGMQTASGLAAAHAQGLVHRDIKPANILLENGVERVKITDFGLARAVDDVGMTQTGVVAGTPQFMAPEQANGESIDVRSDLFSLGSVLYTLCTGRPPFRATTTMGLLKRICEETPRPIREMNPEIPEWLDAIITRLLKKNANDRYQSAKEVAELLSNWLAHVQRPTAVPAPEQKINDGTNGTDATDGTKLSSPSAAVADVTLKSVPQRTTWQSELWGDYSKSVPFSGNHEKSFDLALASLVSSGFVLNRRTPSQLTLTGPGLNQLKGNLLAAASSIDVTQESGSIRLDAKMGTLRTLHAFLLGLLLVAAIIILTYCVNPAAGPFRAQRNQIEGGIFAFSAIGLLVIGSIIASRRVCQKTFDNFLTNLLTAGGTGRTSGTIDSVTVNEIAAPRPSSSATGQNPWSTNSFWQRIREAYPTRAYWSLLAVWGLWMIPIADALETIVVKGLFWVALTIIVLGILLPIGLATFAWGQRRTSGRWETTILRRSPVRLLLMPAIIPFLFAATFWGYRQLTCGKIEFDVDDPDFTISLFSPEKKWDRSYSADFYALRLSPGKYYWSVKHGATFINQGELYLTSRSRHTISARSPYPLGQAALMSLPGRWKLQGRQPYGKPSNLLTSEADYIDVAGDSIQIHSQCVLDTWSPLLERRAGNKREDVDTQDVSFSFQIPTEPPKNRGAKWIDLYVKNGPSHTSRLFARGIFMADEKFFVIRLVPARMPRPTNWNLTPEDKSISLTFQRADDLTLMQGKWNLNECSEKSVQVDDVNFVITKNQMELINLTKDNGSTTSLTANKFTIRIDAAHAPKKLMLTVPQHNGVTSTVEGVYKIDGDKLILSIESGGRIALNFGDPAGTAPLMFELERATP